MDFIPKYVLLGFMPALPTTPNCMVLDSDDYQAMEELINMLSSNLIGFYIGSDIIGNEIGAALKNVYGIAAGMLDGLVMEVLRGERMLNEIASYYEVHPNMMTRWKTDATNNFHLPF